MQLNQLAQQIQQTHVVLQQSAAKAINLHLTLRNWLIGFYIVEFEQKGEDRAAYGERLLANLAASLKLKSVSNSSERELRRYRSFYLEYRYLSEKIVGTPLYLNIRQTLSSEFDITVIRQTLSPESHASLKVPAEKILARLSYSHLAELLEVSNPIYRTFYEIACIKGNWSVRELRRQIHSMYAERSGLSVSPEKLEQLVMDKSETMLPTDIIKSVYAFEFLGLKAKDVVEENDLETALLDNLQQFLLEMGHGFCFEARQKRIVIGDEYFHIDLVFYHRVLKCHVLVDLKMEPFTHTNAGQLNTYLNYYKAEVKLPSDNPPVGLLLVTHQNKTLVQYATAGMDNQLFVSKYLVELPSTEILQRFVQQELEQL